MTDYGTAPEGETLQQFEFRMGWPLEAEVSIPARAALLRAIHQVPIAAVQARVIAHRFGIPWERVPELTEELDGPAGYLSESLSEAAGLIDWKAEPIMSDVVAGIFSLCGSPIEELFLATMAQNGFTWNSGYGCHPNVPPYSGECSGGHVWQQLPVLGYKLDFAIVRDGADTGVAIELDGHDFHERTKEQAQHDKSRDRKLQAAGWRVLRFTGSEVWKDPAKCVREAISLADALRRTS